MTLVLAHEQHAVDELARHLRDCIESGGVALIPTETVYGLVASPQQAASLDRLYRSKQRSKAKPIALLLPNRPALDALLDEIAAMEHLDAEMLEQIAATARTLLPGPLTLVVPRPAHFMPLLVDHGPSIGIRLSADPFLSRLLVETGPLAATSANLSGKSAAIGDAAELAEIIADLEPDLAILAGPTTYRMASTVLDITTTPPRLLREGAMPRDRIAPLLPPRSLRGIAGVVLATLASGILLAAPMRAAAEVAELASGDLRISTASTDYDIASGVFTMPHHVHADRPGMQIDGDTAHGNTRRRIVVLTGHVILHQDGGAHPDALIAPRLESATPSTNSPPSTLTAERLSINLATKISIADGHVHFVQGTRTVDAKQATLNEVTHDLFLSGDVTVVDGHQRLAAQRMTYNTKTQQVHATENVEIVVPLPSPSPGPSATPPPHRRR